MTGGNPAGGGKNPGNASSAPQVAPAVLASGAAGAQHAGVLASAPVTRYVQGLTKDDFHPKATAAVAAETKTFIDVLIRNSREIAHIERLQTVDERHVRDAASDLRRRKDDAWIKVVSDWMKRIGFIFLGFSVQQGLILKNQHPIKGGSVAWFAADLVLSTALISLGAVFDGLLDRFLRGRPKK